MTVARLLARLLNGDEREAVLGDLAEAGVNGARAALDVAGLVARRQAALWKEWRPWAALCLAIPLGWLLGRAAIGALRGLDLWILLNRADLDPAVLAENGMSVRHSVIALLRDVAVLPGAAVASGVALGWLARRAVWVHAALFGMLAVLYTLPLMLHFGDYWLLAKLGAFVMLPVGFGVRLGRKAAA